MSYWTFTDIFEENGPVPSPFHGGFGLINFQGAAQAGVSMRINFSTG
jgi:beta-xylosidase